MGMMTLPRGSPIVRLFAYYVLLAGAVWALLSLFPGIPELEQRFRDISALSAGSRGRSFTDVSTGLETLSQGDLVLITLLASLAALALVVPVAYVYMVTKRRRGYDQSVVQTVIILPMAVAGTVILVQNSIALAFALGAVMAAVRFRNTLKDTKDAVYIFLALAVGVAAGVFAPAVAATMSVVFNLVVLALWYFNIGNIYVDQRGRVEPLRPGEALLGPGKTGEFPPSGCPLQPVEIGHSGLFKEELRRLGPEAGNRQKLQEPRRYLGLQLFMGMDETGRTVLLDLGGQFLADPGDLPQLLPGEGLHPLRNLLQVEGSPTVGPDLEGVVPLYLQDVGHLGEYAGELEVFHENTPLVITVSGVSLVPRVLCGHSFKFRVFRSLAVLRLLGLGPARPASPRLARKRNPSEFVRRTNRTGH